MKVIGIGNVRNQENTNFNGLWRVKGTETALDDISEALYKRSSHFSNHLQFLRIRLQAPPLPPLAKILKNPSSMELADPKILGKIEELLLDEISLRQHGSPVNNHPNNFIDLFVTNEDKITVETKMSDILRDSCKILKNNIKVIMAKYFANRQKIETGRPIEDFLVAALEKNTPIKVNNVMLYQNPNEVISHMSSGHFDFVSGLPI